MRGGRLLHGGERLMLAVVRLLATEGGNRLISALGGAAESG